MTLIRLINHKGDPEYITVEDVWRISYHPGYERVIVSLGDEGDFHAPADMSVDEVRASIEASQAPAQEDPGGGS